MLLTFMFLTISPEGPWTREIRSLDETIKAYSMLETTEVQRSYYSVVKNMINSSIITVGSKKNYLNFVEKKIKELSTAQKIILYKGKFLIE